MSSSHRVVDDEDLEMDVSSSHGNDSSEVRGAQNQNASSSGAGHAPGSTHRLPSAIDSSAYHFSATPSPDSVPLEILATDNHPIEFSTTSDHGSNILGFDGISSSMHSELEDLEQFRHHSLSEVDMPPSMGATGGGFAWDEEIGDIFTFGMSDSGSLMHHPEIGNPVDEADGTNLPDSSSSSTSRKKNKSGKSKIQPGTSSSKSADPPNSQYPVDFAESGSSHIQSPFSFEESDTELECTSSSDLFIDNKKSKQKGLAKGNKNTKRLKHAIKTEPGNPPSSEYTVKIQNILPDQPIDPEKFLAENRLESSVELRLSNFPGSGHPEDLTGDRRHQSVVNSTAGPSHRLQIGVDTTIAAGEPKVTCGSKVHGFPSDILKTVSPPKRSATIMLQPQPVDAQLVDPLAPDTPDNLANSVSLPGNEPVSSLSLPSEQEHGWVQEAHSSTSLRGSSSQGSSQSHRNSSKKRSENHVSSSGVRPSPKQDKWRAMSEIGTTTGSRTLQSPSQCETIPVTSNSNPVTFQDDSWDLQAVNTSSTDACRSGEALGSSPTGHHSKVKQATSTSAVTPPVSVDCIHQFELLPGAIPKDSGITGRGGVLSDETREASSANNETFRDAGVVKARTVCPVPKRDPKNANDVCGGESSPMLDSTAPQSQPSSQKSYANSDNSHTHSTKHPHTIGKDHPGTSTTSNASGDTILSNLEEKASCPDVAKTRTSSLFEGDVPGTSTETNSSRRTTGGDSQHNGDSALPEYVDMETIEIPSSDDEETGGMEEQAGDSDMSTSDIDDLLEQDLPSEYTRALKGKKRTADGEEKREEGADGATTTPGFSIREPTENEAALGITSVRMKRTFVKRGRDPLEGLPQDWIGITHRCGLDVYMHKPTRVCTWSRPYPIGEGSARKHSVPLASIRCLHYKRAKVAEGGVAAESDSNKKQCLQPESGEGGTATTGGSVSKTPDGSGDGTPLPTEEAGASTTPAETEAAPGSGENGNDVDNSLKNKLKYQPEEALGPEELHEYVKKLFDFKNVPFRKFKTWAGRRNFYKLEKKVKETQGEGAKDKDRPKLPMVPTFEATFQSNFNDRVTKKKELAISMTDKSSVSILHEYCQRVLRIHPKYLIEERNNANFPFEAVVLIEGQKYGRGQAPNKKVARNNAARETLKILIPNVMSQTEEHDTSSVEFFDQIAIDDPRVGDLCIKTGNMTPYMVLNDCKLRMFGKKGTEFNYNVTVEAHCKVVYTMSLGPHSAAGPCKNARVGKQLGAQKILQQIYPKVKTWGGIMKIYGKGVVEIANSKKEEEQKIFALSKKEKNKPNEKILAKLREEMRKAYSAKIQDEQAQQQSKEASTSTTIDDITSKATT